MIEAMACGTPMIAFRCGSVPEVIDPGVSGFIVESVEAAVAAVAKLPNLDRAKVRAAFEAALASNGWRTTMSELYRRLPGVRAETPQLSLVGDDFQAVA